MQYFIARLLKQRSQTTENEQIFFADFTSHENAVASNSITNIRIFKNIYKNLHGAVADGLGQASNYIDKEQLKK